VPVATLLHLLGPARPRVLVFPGAYRLRRRQARRRTLHLRPLLVMAVRMLAAAGLARTCAGPAGKTSLPLLAQPARLQLVVDASASMQRYGGPR
jgi:hypothetical protein